MKASELREKNATELNEEVLSLLQEQFNLRMQRASGNMSRPHRMKEIRRDIARIKTIMKQGEAK